MFDFDLEVEPILQVLVGKCLEAARIEVLEVDESRNLQEFKKKFKQTREAALVETQRLEAQRFRANDEIDRRNVQQRTAQVTKVWQEKKEIARLCSRQFLGTFKRDNLKYLTEIGLLRSKREYSFGKNYLPMLYQQAIQDMRQADTLDDDVSGVVEKFVRDKADAHKQAIKDEMQRREDKKNEEARIKREAEKAQARRRERRRCLREQVRIGQI